MAGRAISVNDSSIWGKEVIECDTAPAGLLSVKALREGNHIGGTGLNAYADDMGGLKFYEEKSGFQTLRRSLDTVVPSALA